MGQILDYGLILISESPAFTMRNIRGGIKDRGRRGKSFLRNETVFIFYENA